VVIAWAFEKDCLQNKLPDSVRHAGEAKVIIFKKDLSGRMTNFWLQTCLL
jgi:hypothetical protein